MCIVATLCLGLILAGYGVGNLEAGWRRRQQAESTQQYQPAQGDCVGGNCANGRCLTPYGVKLQEAKATAAACSVVYEAGEFYCVTNGIKTKIAVTGFDQTACKCGLNCVCREKSVSNVDRSVTDHPWQMIAEHESATPHDIAVNAVEAFEGLVATLRHEDVGWQAMQSE
jgi:hypothetical protein